ncbi:MAG TPA: glycosyltransferase family 2 protein, partial [Actinotalea sp.]|nr:glycosyltransferase family 2 protein [Actinotalea sp.]
MIVGRDEDPEVVAVVPTLGGDLPRLEACLTSVLGSRTAARLAVVVVWNDPRRAVPELGSVTVLRPGLNLGFPGGLAYARAAVTATYLWVVQDDMVVAPDCLDRLLDRLGRSDAPAVAAPVVLDEDGRVPARSRGGMLDGQGGISRMAPPEAVAPEDLDPVVDWVASSGSLIRLTAWDDAGGFDPAFFPLLWSDVDFGARALAAGHRSVLEPAARVAHRVNGSTPPLLGEHLGSVQSARFARKHRGEEPRADLDPELDPAVLAAVARSATLGYVDLAQFASRRTAALRRSAEELAAALDASGNALAAATDRLAAADD